MTYRILCILCILFLLAGSLSARAASTQARAVGGDVDGAGDTVPLEGGGTGDTLAGASASRTGLFTENPLDLILGELRGVLDDAGVPFDARQEASIIFVLEESRLASEQLFGNVMNFSNGPPRGENVERAMAGIAWMNEDFRRRVRDYLSVEQLEAWNSIVGDDETVTVATPATQSSRQVQQIRINNNSFSAENGSVGGSSVQAQVIQRGGTGAWHGNSQIQFRDDALNARNPFAANKPPYQQRNLNGSVSGPLIRDRLTLSLSLTDSKSDSPITINAETLSGPVQYGLTRLQSTRNGNVSGIYQLAEDQSLHFNAYLRRGRSDNQNVGGTNLEERAVDYTYGNENFSLRHVWFHSDRLVQDISYSTSSGYQEAIPRTTGVMINVSGAFSGGGGSSGSSEDRTHELSTLWIYTGDAYSIRTGGSIYRPWQVETSLDNFQGTFRFRNLDDYQNGLPYEYSVRAGEPTLAYSKLDWSSFIQYEQRLSPRFTLFYGLRYEHQSNVDDDNNFDPRLSMAYAIGSATVVRAGVGVYHSSVSSSVEFNLLRLDGTRQYEIEIQNPSYPNPFQSGSGTIVPPASRRVRADDLETPYQINSSVQIERSFPHNLFVSASFESSRYYHSLRSRNLNAPLPGYTTPPDPSEGKIWLLESTGTGGSRQLRLSMRQRFSIFNLDANYSYQISESDSMGTFNPPSNSYDLRADRYSVGEHSFSTRINSRLPLDVYLTTNLSWSSGNAYTITTGFDDNGDGEFNDRPPGVPRYSERGPYRHNVSFNISKAFPIGSNETGGASLSLYANMDNAFNRTNLGTPVSVQSSSRFGQYISASNPREIQVGMRFSF